MDTFDEILKILKPAFNTAEFAAACKRSRAYAWLALNRLKAKKKIIHLRRGWWAKPDAMAQEAAAIYAYPAYLSFHSALSIHGLTTQIPRTIQLAVNRKARKFNMMEMQVQELRVPNELFGGFEAKKELPLAKPEKAFADCLRLPRACPDIILAEALPKLDEAKILQYCDERMKKRFLKVKKLCSQERN